MYGVAERGVNSYPPQVHGVGAQPLSPSPTNGFQADQSGHDGTRQVTRSPSPDLSGLDGLRRRAPSNQGGNVGVQTRSLLDDVGSDDEDFSDDEGSVSGRSRADSNASVQQDAGEERSVEERSVAWEKLAAVGGRFKDWIVGVASKFAFVGEIVGAIVGGVTAVVLAAGTIGIVPLIWNANASPGDDYITSFVLAGATAGKYLGGAVGGVVGVVTSPIGVSVTAACEACTSPESSGYAPVGSDLELDNYA